MSNQNEMGSNSPSKSIDYQDFFTKVMSPQYSYPADVTAVYDGDTITCNIKLGFGVELKKQKIRFYGINTPEIRGSDKANGIISRDFVRDKILEKTITLHTIKDKKGKYGRWLGIIMIDGINLNLELIQKGLAKFVDY